MFTPFSATATTIKITELTEKLVPVIGDEIQISDSEDSDSSKKITLEELINVAAGGVEVGTVVSFTGAVAPTGYLICDGTTLDRTVYADLYAVTGDAYGNGDGATTFQIADFRGKFLRGVDGGAANDLDAATRIASGTGGNVGDAIGSAQDFASKNHKHFSGSGLSSSSNLTYFPYGGLYQNWGVGNKLYINSGGLAPTFAQGNTETVGESANETRPINVNVNYIVKY